MRHILAVFINLFLYSLISLHGQDTIKLEPSRNLERKIAPEEKHIYLLDLDSSQFAYGELNQQSLDVTINIYSPENNLIEKIDETGRYLELFHIESLKSGTYCIEVSPYIADSGLYSIEIKTIKPLALTPEKQLDQLIEAYYSNERPGGAVAVLDEGKVVYTRAYGKANLIHGVPFTVETSSNIGSISKQFTAFAILLLEKEGKLSLTDDIRKYIPELPDFGKPVILLNLLNHTSGYREIWETLLMQGKIPGFWTRKEIISQIQRQSELQSDPGAKYRYSNTNYILLSEVITKLTGVPFPEWMKLNVFDPLNMKNTNIISTSSQIILNSAQGYTFSAEDAQFKKGVDIDAFYGASSIYTTVGDLSKWCNNFKDARLGGPEVISRMTERGILTNGDTIDYALGILIKKHRGLLRYSHTGGDGGQRSSLQYYPEIGSGIAIIGNGLIYSTISDKFKEVFLEKNFAPVEIKESTEIQDEKDTTEMIFPFPEAILGRFGSDAANLVINFIEENNRLFVQFDRGSDHQSQIPLKLQSDSVFYDVNNDIKVTFTWDTNGQVNLATVWSRYSDELEFRRLPDYNPSKEDLEIFTGLYYSPELETTYTIVIDDNKLTLKYHRFENNKLMPKEQDRFSARYPLLGIHFERDDKGEVSGFVTRNVHFEKVK